MIILSFEFLRRIVLKNHIQSKSHGEKDAKSYHQEDKVTHILFRIIFVRDSYDGQNFLRKVLRYNLHIRDVIQVL